MPTVRLNTHWTLSLIKPTTSQQHQSALQYKHTIPLSYIFYGVSLASVSCHRRWPSPTTLALTMLNWASRAHCELRGGMLNWASFFQLGRNFHTDLATCHSWSSKMAVRWQHCRHKLCQPKLTPVSLISMAVTRIVPSANTMLLLLSTTFSVGVMRYTASSDGSGSLFLFMSSTTTNMQMN